MGGQMKATLYLKSGRSRGEDGLYWANFTPRFCQQGPYPLHLMLYINYSRKFMQPYSKSPSNQFHLYCQLDIYRSLQGHNLRIVVLILRHPS
jgi:hypothetical protein